MIDTLNLIVRQIVRVVMSMPSGSVRPSDQSAPAGGQGSPYATVKIISCEGLGASTGTVEPDGAGGFVEMIEVPTRFMASVNFFGSTTKDAAGIAKYSNEAFDRAARIATLFELSVNVDLLQRTGLGFLKASTPRNLAGLADATWQSRGQVDLTFAIINREQAAIGTLLSAAYALTTLSPDGVLHTRAFEVTP